MYLCCHQTRRTRRNSYDPRTSTAVILSLLYVLIFRLPDCRPTMFQVGTSSYIPAHSLRNPFPLATRNPNACPRLSDYMATGAKLSNNKLAPAQNRCMQNPLFKRKSNEDQHQRRQVYLKKVRQVSEDKKWESRSEQVRHPLLDITWRDDGADKSPARY